MILPGDEPTGCVIYADGNRVVSRDVFYNGELGCLKGDLGQHESPEHAEAMVLLYNRADFLLLAAEGKITQDVVDKLVSLIRERKANGNWPATREQRRGDDIACPTY